MVKLGAKVINLTQNSLFFCQLFYGKFAYLNFFSNFARVSFSYVSNRQYEYTERII